MYVYMQSSGILGPNLKTKSINIIYVWVDIHVIYTPSISMGPPISRTQ